MTWTLAIYICLAAAGCWSQADSQIVIYEYGFPDKRACIDRAWALWHEAVTRDGATGRLVECWKERKA